MTTKTSKNGKKQDLKAQFSQEDLHVALRDLFDLFEKLSGTKCLLLGETARTVKAGRLDVDRLQAGIRQLDLTPERKGTIYSHLADYLRRGYTKTMVFEPDSPPAGELLISYDFMGIPIDITVINTPNPYIDNPDPITYNFDYFVIPNPLEEYLRG